MVIIIGESLIKTPKEKENKISIAPDSEREFNLISNGSALSLVKFEHDSKQEFSLISRYIILSLL